MGSELFDKIEKRVIFLYKKYSHTFLSIEFFLILSRSPLQKEQFVAAHNKRWLPEQSTGPSQQPDTINIRRYVLATLTKGLSETTARRFLAKLNITPSKKPIQSVLNKDIDKAYSICQEFNKGNQNTDYC